MSTNDRRTIAGELRRKANDSLDGESLQRALARIAGADDSSWRGVMRRLADLIGPPLTCNIMGDDNSFICEKCGGEPASPLINGFPAGQESHPRAIVMFETGDVRCVHVNAIQVINAEGIFNEYAFPQNDGSTSPI